MRNLSERLSKLEHKSGNSGPDVILLVQFVEPGEVRELSEIHAASGDFSCRRNEGETENEFIARAELEAKESIRPLPNSATLLIGESA